MHALNDSVRIYIPEMEELGPSPLSVFVIQVRSDLLYNLSCLLNTFKLSFWSQCPHKRLLTGFVYFSFFCEDSAILRARMLCLFMLLAMESSNRSVHFVLGFFL